MRIEVLDGVVTTTHKDQVLEWLAFKKPNQWEHKPEDLFVEINGFWAAQSDSVQQEIFDVYVACHNTFLNVQDERELCKRVQQYLVTLLDKYHPIEKVRPYIVDLDITIPDTVETDFDSNDGRKHVELTYVRTEYFDLIVATCQLRTIFPIWNMYKDNIRPTDNSSRVYADIELLRTLKFTKFIASPAMLRLQVYVHAAYARQDRSAELSSIIAGPGTIEIPNYMYASTIANRLITTPIVIKKDRTNLITSIYTKVRHDASHLGDKFNQHVNARSETRMGSADDDKIGYLESYSVRQDVADDIYLTNQVYLYDYRKVRRHLDDGIPSSLVKACIESFEKFPPRPIRKDQYTLVQWVLSKTVMPRAIPYVDRQAIINAMGVTQAALIHWGFPEIATLLSARPIPLGDELITTNLTPLWQMDTGLKDKLSKIYPYFRPQGNLAARSLWPGYLAIEKFSTLLTDRRWELTCSKEIAQKLRQQTGEIKLHTTLKNSLAELLTKIDRNYHATQGE